MTINHQYICSRCSISLMRISYYFCGSLGRLDHETSKARVCQRCKDSQHAYLLNCVSLLLGHKP